MRARHLVRIFILTLLVSISCFAVETSIWEQTSYEDFHKDTPKNISIASKGDIQLAPKLDQFSKLQTEYIWDITEDSNGNIYAGTGNEGKIYKIQPDGTSSLFYDSPEVGILSLTVDADNNLYAGTSPDGLVYKINSEGIPTKQISLEEKYVWDLTFDSWGNLYAATGTNGKIFKIAPDGKYSVVFDSEETHIMCLLNRGGVIYAGSADGGIIYKLDEKDHVSVVYQTGQKEVHCLAMDNQKNLYAGTTTEVSPKPGEPPPRHGKKKEESRIYRITPEGFVSLLWTAPVPLILSLTTDDDGNLITGTGSEGKIYSVNMKGESTYLTKCKEADVLSIYKSKKELLLSTGNPGKLYKLSKSFVNEGTIKSEVHDTKLISKWGMIKWETKIPQGTSVTFATRSGNTAKPDNTWNEWSGELTASEGVKIPSPSARFIQWRAKINTTDTSLTPVLKKISVAYIHTNVKPEFGPVNIVKGVPKSRNGPPSRRRQNNSNHTSKRTIKWAVKDINNDKLEFSVYYKGMNEPNWRLLKEELTEPMYSYDSNSMPDGRYQIKIVASDKLSNPHYMAKTNEKVSAPFEIDNSQPSVGKITATKIDNGKYHIECTATDNTSRIASAVYSIDSGEDWLILFPVDGIFDSKVEKFSFDTEKLPEGQHTIVIKVKDAESIVSSGKMSF